MATIKKGFVNLSWLMSNKNPKSKRPVRSSVEYNVPAAAVTAYNGAADDTARAATLIGALRDAADDLSIGVPVEVQAGFRYVQDTALPPAVSAMAFAFDKIGISYNADGEYYVSSIPARSKDGDIVTLAPDGETILTGTGASAEVLAFVAAFNGVVLSEENVAGTIVNMNIRS